MAAKPELGKLGQLVVSSLEKIIKNASWRKHQKLVHDCKSLIEWFGKHPKPGVDWSTLAAPGGPRVDGKAEGAEGDAPPAVAISYPHSLFDEGQMAVSAADTDFILQPLHAACETLAAKVVEPALDCFQKMIAHGHLRGEMDVGGPNENKALTQVGGWDPSSPASGPLALIPLIRPNHMLSCSSCDYGARETSLHIPKVCPLRLLSR